MPELKTKVNETDELIDKFGESHEEVMQGIYKSWIKLDEISKS